ncbi:hypothetical protein IG631_22196 [Alternaria alternata]|nr:hypothetical protein IG631_22196 [Alternaria alternata]
MKSPAVEVTVLMRSAHSDYQLKVLASRPSATSRLMLPEALVRETSKSPTTSRQHLTTAFTPATYIPLPAT